MCTPTAAKHRSFRHPNGIAWNNGRALTTHCLIKCVGRKSAKVHVRPLIYGNVGGEIVIVASKGGADTHPGWYLNVLESNTIGVQIATQAFEATWREPEGEERHQVWAYMAHLYPPYLTYQQSTNRQSQMTLDWNSTRFFRAVRPLMLLTAMVFRRLSPGSRVHTWRR